MGLARMDFMNWARTPQALLERKESLDEAGGPAGWRPCRLILQNYWRFAYEEFQFVHGRLVLRGANATGKSTVLVSAITLALDGEKRRDRLDTFGGQGRGIAYYLVGQPDAGPDSDFYFEERTGYVALEFEKDGEYLTVGVGLYTNRNRASLSVDSWGFAITDGRRIGIDMDLFDDERVPFTPRRLEGELGMGGQVVTRAADYQALVNRLLFGFDTAEEYQFLLSLLLQLRSPKLNKDTKPSDICDMLTLSLPPLPVELLEQVTQIIEDIDTCLETLEETDQRLKAVSEIDDRQAHYLNQLAQRAAVHYLEAHRILAAAVKDRDVARSELEQQRTELAAVRAGLQANAHSREQTVGELQVLEQHEAFKDQQRIQLLEEDLRKEEENLRRTERGYSESEERVKRVVDRCHRLTEEWAGQLAGLKEGARELQDRAKEAAWPLAGQQATGVGALMSRLKLEEELDLAASLPVATARSAARERISVLKRVQDSLSQVDKARQAHEAARELLRREEAALQDADRSAQAAAGQVEQARVDASQAVTAWAESCLFWQVEEDALQRSLEAIEAFPAAGKEIHALVRPLLEAAGDVEERLQYAERRLALARDHKEQERSQVERELTEWQQRKDPEPPRRDGQIEARRLLASQDIDAVPLYAGSEFVTGVPDQTAADIEETLQQAGLLDALVIPAGRSEEVAGILDDAGLGDHWIRPNPRGTIGSTQTLLAVLRPADDHPQATAVRQALASIAWVEDPAQVEMYAGEGAGPHAVVGPGAWRVGPLRGTADARSEPQVLFIGEANRRRYRQAVIARLKETLEKLDLELFELENQLDEARRESECFRQEVEALRDLPAWDHLRTAAVAHEQAVRWLEERRTAVEAAATKAEEAYRALTGARTAYQKAVEGIPEARGRNTEGLQDLITAAREYVNSFDALQREARQLDRLRTQVYALQEEEKAARKRLAEDEITLENVRSKAGALRARRDAVKRHLEELGVSIEELNQRIRGLRDHLEVLAKERSRLDKREGALAHAVMKSESILAEREQQVEAGKAEEAAASDALRERIEAYPTLRPLRTRFAKDSGGPLAVAQELLKLRRSSEERMAEAVEKSVNEAITALAKAFADHRSLLVEYSPELDGGMVTFHQPGGRIKPHALRSLLHDEFVLHQRVLRERESELYEEVILRDVAREIRSRIAMAQEWRDEVNGLLEGQELSNGEVLSISWRPKPPDRVTGVNHGRIVDLLRRDVDTLTDAEVTELIEHFRRRVGDVRERYQRNALLDKSFADALAEVLDYREWFQFALHSKLPREDRRQLSDVRFAARSGAEKSLAMFIPILAAVYARYNAARPDAPRLVGIDEAFAGVDEQNIREMFRFLVELGFSWIMTSEKLWGVSDTLPACSTYELVKGDGSVVTPVWFVWDGRVLDDALNGPREGVAGGGR